MIETMAPPSDKRSRHRSYKKEGRATVDVSTRHDRETMLFFDELCKIERFQPTRSAMIAVLVEEYVDQNKKKLSADVVRDVERRAAEPLEKKKRKSKP